MTTAKRFLLVLAIATGLALLGAGMALAAGTNIPHGGYSTSTDACLQCHDVHESSSDYVLLRYKTVTDTCGSCHYLYDINPGTNVTNASNPILKGYLSRSPASLTGSYGTPGITPAYDPGFSGAEAPAIGLGVSVGSQYRAYEVNLADADSAPGHQLQRGPGMWLFEDGVSAFADYIPGGSSFLTAIKKADYPNTVNTLSFSGTQGLFCASCHTPHGNFGQELKRNDGAVTTTKILSGKPNHNADPRWDPNQPAGVGNPALKVDTWSSQGGRWCAQCHNRRLENVQWHNHPDFACLQCHGNYVGSNLAGQQYNTALLTDFPHTGNAGKILSNEPDALCITCHTAGTLP